FLAYEIIKRLQETNQTEILQQLQDAVTAREKAKDQLHKAFEESFDAKSIDNKNSLQKLTTYILMRFVLAGTETFKE
ncbi:MAG: hypothetical protein ABJA35_17425, partial [Parafilimonas sp.]